MKYERFYNFVLIGSLIGSIFFFGMAFMIFDEGNYSFYGLKAAFQIGLFFPSLVVADLLFRGLMKRKIHLSIALCSFVLPIVLEGLISFYFDRGYIPAKYLPEDDYRYFWGTPAYPLVRDIAQGKDANPVLSREAIDYQDTVSGMTPLLYCIRNQYYDKAIKLLERGASPNIVNSRTGNSPLTELCISYVYETTGEKEKKRLLEVLLDRGADVNYVHDGQWPLLISCSQWPLDMDWCKQLINKGANLNIKNIQEDEYLHECYKENESALNSAVYHGNFELAMTMIQLGADTTGYRDWMIDIMSSKYNANLENDSAAQALYGYLKKQ